MIYFPGRYLADPGNSKVSVFYILASIQLRSWQVNLGLI